jgi:hypothetical protein
MKKRPIMWKSLGIKDEEYSLFWEETQLVGPAGQPGHAAPIPKFFTTA